ncbi:MAG: chloride channel protein [Methylobacteriaceae bacterium]|nr:chloride channel protein [Methylobacteriaceae bacterium]
MSGSAARPVAESGLERAEVGLRQDRLARGPGPRGDDVAPAAASATGWRAPESLRAVVRGSELALLGLGAFVGALAGVLVAGIGALTQISHEILFSLERGERLSSAMRLDPINVLVAPVGGGCLLGLLILAVRYRWRRAKPGRTGNPPPPVDPIEANALHGGRLSLRESVLVVVQNVVSNGSGASVGLEAAYTQISSALASKLGGVFEARRGDLRVLVGCGAAAAIAAAFNAPLTGAFYAFEHVIGTYAAASLAPVVGAALAGTLVTRALVGQPIYVISMGAIPPVHAIDYLPALALGMLCAAFGIGVMQAVSGVETALRRAKLPTSARPALGGLLVGCVGLVTPQALSAGHGALHLNLNDAETTVAIIAAVLAAKTVASVVSLGSGFRGGLFFASPCLGALLGKLFALLVPALTPFAALPPVTYALVGMSALAAAIVGGPLTMTFLALEVTGDLPISALALAGALASSVTVRKTFGYSFATWRFHLRGESIRGAADVGWIRNLTVGQLMRRDLRTVRDDTPLAALRRDFPLGSTQRVILVDERDRYAGLVSVAEAHDRTLEEKLSTLKARDLARFRTSVLLPSMNAKEAAGLFESAEAEALAVVDGRETGRVIGLLTESYTLRRYSEELDLRRREIVGET